MMLRLSRFAICGGLLAAMGCQNTFDRPAGFADSLETRFSMSSDDPSGLDVGRGHSPSLASELADRRREAEPKTAQASAETIRSLLERGHEELAQGRLVEAKMHYEQVLAEDPDHAEAHHRLAILADRSGDYASAEEHYQAALKANPSDADVLNDLGYSCFLQGRAADSERYLSRAQKINPRHPHVEENLSLLYDREKAERVLRSVMGPRQTQATLVKLFPETAGAARQDALAQAPEPKPAKIYPTDVTPASSVEVLQQKMAEARQQSLAERARRSAAQQPAEIADVSSNIPRVPANYPPPAAASTDYQTAGPIPDGQINDAFRAIDQGGAMPVDPYAFSNPEPMELYPGQVEAPPAPAGPSHYSRRPQPNPVVQHDPRSVREGRPAGLQGNTPPTAWPDSPAESGSRSMIQQVGYNEPADSMPSLNRRPSLPTAAERAAEIGMAAGPGSIFPPIDEAGAEAPMSASRPRLGTQSRITGTMSREPNRQPAPPAWNHAPQQRSVQPASNQWDHFPAEGNPRQPEVFPDQFKAIPQTPADSYTGSPQPEEYDQVRSRHQAQLNHNQRALAASPGLTSNAPPARQSVPQSFDANPQPWPAAQREPYNPAPQDLPVITPNPRYPQPNNPGQSAPTSTQQPPPNYGGNW